MQRIMNTRSGIGPGTPRKARASLLAALTLTSGGATFAGLGGGGGAHTWTGNVNTSWHNSGNWNTGEVPLTGDSAIVLGGANNIVLFADTAPLHSLFVAGARTLSTNGHVLNVTSGDATTTVSGLGSALVVSPSPVPFALATDLLRLQSSADLQMAGGWVLASELQMASDARIIGHGWIDIDSPSLNAFNGLDGSAITVTGGDLNVRIFSGGSMSLPDTINVQQAGNELQLTGHVLTPLQNVNIGSSTGLSVEDNWTLAGLLTAATAAGQQAYVAGEGAMSVTGNITVTSNSHLRLDSTARFEGSSSVAVNGNATLEVNDWYDSDAGHTTTLAPGGRLLLDGPQLASGWDGAITSNAGIIEVNGATNLQMNGVLTLGSFAGLRTTIAGSSTLAANGVVNAPGLGAFVNGRLDLRPNAAMNLGTSAQIFTNGMLLLRDDSDTLGDGAITVNSGGTLVLEEDALVAVDIFNDGTMKAGEFDQMQHAMIFGSLTQTATGRLMVELGGPDFPAHDVYEVGQAVTLDGEVVVNLVNGFVPKVGDTFDIVWADGGVSGVFDAVTGVDGFSVTASGSVVTLVYNGVSACPADINADGAINIDDLLAVISAWGACAGCDADINQSGMVDIDDLLAVISAWGQCS